MKMLVTGATGFVGTEVTRALAQRSDVTTRALVRRPDRAPLVTRFGVDAVFGDLSAPDSIRRAVDDVDAVIHLAGRATFESYDRIAPTIVDGTRCVVRAAVDAGVSTVVLGSSAFVYDAVDGPDECIGRHTEARPALDYGRAKLDAEAAALAEANGSSTSIAALRLPHVFGPQSLLFGLVRRRLVPFPGTGENRFAQLHVRDAAAALVAAAETGWAGTAPVAADSPTWNEFFAVLTDAAPRVRVLRVPAGLASTAAAFVGPVLSRLTPTMVSPDTVRGWNLDLPVDGSSVWDELGIEPELGSITRSIPATLDGSVAFRWRHPLADFS